MWQLAAARAIALRAEEAPHSSICIVWPQLDNPVSLLRTRIELDDCKVVCC